MRKQELVKLVGQDVAVDYGSYRRADDKGPVEASRCRLLGVEETKYEGTRYRVADVRRDGEVSTYEHSARARDIWGTWETFAALAEDRAERDARARAAAQKYREAEVAFAADVRGLDESLGTDLRMRGFHRNTEDRRRRVEVDAEALYQLLKRVNDERGAA